MPEEDGAKPERPTLQALFGVPERCEIDSDYIRQVASIGLRTGRLTEMQVKEICGSVMEHIAKRT